MKPIDYAAIPELEYDWKVEQEAKPVPTQLDRMEVALDNIVANLIDDQDSLTWP